MDKYVTTQGDTWDLIAYRVYGSEYQMHRLLEANPEHRETVIFPANVELSIPSIEQPKDEALPPWKR